MDSLNLKALAKINLGLDVVGRRENGYHDVRMIMQTIYLYDNISMRKTKETGIFLSSNLQYLPSDEKNLAYRAAKILMDEFQIKQGVEIKLDKHIPVAAGLAGGSTDAAAVLFGMNQLFRLKLSEKDLMERGVALGADVPYCVMRGTALAEGIGEELTQLPSMPKCCVLIAKPPTGASTKVIYEELDSKEIEEHPDIDGMIEAIKEQDLEKIVSKMGNVLEPVTMAHCPDIGIIKNLMLEGGAMNAMMSGSGPTVFGIFRNQKEATEAMRAVRDSGLARQVFVANVHRKQTGGSYGSKLY